MNLHDSMDESILNSDHEYWFRFILHAYRDKVIHFFSYDVPDGWSSFKRINRKLHKAGISSFSHIYAFVADKNRKYVAPMPSKKLGYYRTFSLQKPMGVKETVIMVNKSPVGISTILQDSWNKTAYHFA